MLAGGLTALLAIVAAASRGDRSVPAGGGGPSDSFWDYFLSTYLVVGAVTFVAIMYLLVRERETLTTRRSKHATVRQLLQFGLVMLALFFVGRILVERLTGDGQLDRTTPAQTRESNRPSGSDGQAKDAREARFRWAPVIVLGALGLAAAAMVAVNRARRSDETSADEVADALADVLDDALGDLRAERDPRRAIIAAYARMERLLGAHGIPRHPSEAPFEYLGRVLLELRASAGSVFELTALFERAKFSRHRVDADMRDEAIAALVAVRDELKAPTGRRRPPGRAGSAGTSVGNDRSSGRGS